MIPKFCSTIWAMVMSLHKSCLPIAFHRDCSIALHYFFGSSSKAIADYRSKECIMSKYLRCELGFSDSEIEKAIRWCPQLVRMQSIKNAQNLIILLRESGYTTEQVKRTFLGHPSILKLKPENLKAKFDFLISLGFNKNRLARLVSTYPRFLTCGLNQTLIPKIRYFERVFNGNKNLVHCLMLNPPFLAANLEGQLIPKMNLLLEWGIEGKLLLLLLHRHHRILNASIDSLKSHFEFVKSMGIEGPSNLFVNALASVGLAGSVERMEERFKVLESFGLGKDDVRKMFRKYPRALHHSAQKIRKNMEFVIHVCGLPLSTIVRYPVLLSYSLDRRIRPRYRVYEYLKTVDPYYFNSTTFRTMLGLTDEQFIRVHVTSSFYVEELVTILEKEGTNSETNVKEGTISM